MDDDVAASLARLRALAARDGRPSRRLRRCSRQLRTSASAALDRVVAVRGLAREVLPPRHRPGRRG